MSQFYKKKNCGERVIYVEGERERGEREREREMDQLQSDY